MAKETKKYPFEDQEESNWHPAEIRRRDIQKLLENTKKLAETYGSFLEIKRGLIDCNIAKSLTISIAILARERVFFTTSARSFAASANAPISPALAI